MSNTRISAVAAALIIGLGLSGCTAATPTADAGTANAPKKGSAEEYSEAFEVFQECMVSRGHRVTDPVVSPVDGMQIIYEATAGTNSKKTYEADFNECYFPFGEVEADFFVTEQPRMTEPLRNEVQTCMGAEGLELSDSAASTNAMREELGVDVSEPLDRSDTAQTLNKCIVSAAKELYPDIPFIPLS